MDKTYLSFRTEFQLSRRDLIKYSIITAGVPTIAVGADIAMETAARGGPGGAWPEFLIKRESDELFLRMRAIGFRAKRGSKTLQPLRWTSDHLLEFVLPPQHCSERTIGVTQIPDVFTEAMLRLVALVPSRTSKLVFRVPAKAIRLRVEDLLDWSRFELLLPDVTAAGELYDLEIPRTEEEAVSRVELPWGIELAPAPDGTALQFTGSPRARSHGGWTELWSTSLEARAPDARLRALAMEIYSTRGFKRLGQSGSADAGNLVITYSISLTGPQPPDNPPIENSERAELAASLSRRFPYTGGIKPPLDSAQIRLVPPSKPFTAAYAPGRTIAVDQFRLSSRGGSLDLLAKFKPYPGSALSSWAHSSTLGRDTFVQVIREGFLFPFGTPCQLIIVSQRAFGRDESGHFVAPLVKQAFLRVHQPNRLDIEHGESPFRSISITTEQSPPLDPPLGSNDPAQYREYDFFLPLVKGVPFAFDHVGTDWAGEQHRASMPHIFVSNSVTAGNGLIWEPGYPWVRTTPPGPVKYPQNSIPPNGEGLRVVDRVWTTVPGRFADYGGTVANLARSATRGSTAQKLDWVEWVRGNSPHLNPDVVIYPPFRPRARTMRVEAQAAEHLSGEKSAMLATYRDTRFTSQPFLDPEPTTPPDFYFDNVTSALDDPETPYLYFLESRPLIGEQGSPKERDPQTVATDLRDLYYRTSGAQAVPAGLFEGISNEIRFGRSQSSDGIGGLSVPDTHASIASRRLGVVGDASFNERRWRGTAEARKKLERANRLDYAAFAKLGRPPYDLTPFDASRTPADRASATAAARKLMGYAAAAPAALLAKPSSGGPFAPGLKLGDLFGADAEVIPGLRFADIFEEIALAGSDDENPVPLIDNDPGTRSARPLAWDVKLLGIDWLRDVQEGRSPALPFVLAELVDQSSPNRSGSPASLGLEATLGWTNSAFKEVTVGPTKFIPDNSRIDIDAAARIDLGIPVISGDPPQLRFTPGKPRIKATTKITSFAIEIFGAIRLNFESVSFTVAEDGSKAFATKLASVELLPPLDFINQLQSMLGGLGGDSGIKIDISPERAMISQTLAFPVGGGPLLIGPAQVTNLSFFWAVTIPLLGRGVLSVAFGISSREKPLTIFVPPWYGGKAYVLIEATTRGCRLVEIAMEYGALIPINWGVARGEASLTAGIFYRLLRDDANDSASVTLEGFVKAASNLSVAGIIRFTGLIYISLRSDEGADGERIVIGSSLIRVSIKIAFVRYSYSFTAKHVQKKNKGSRSALAGPTRDSLPALKSGRGGDNDDVAIRPYGSGFSKDERDALDRLLAGYRTEGRA